MNLIRNAIKEKEDDVGCASLGEIGSYINNVRSDFDSRNYGYSKRSSLIKAFDLFEFKMDKSTAKVKIKKTKNSFLTLSSHRY